MNGRFIIELPTSLSASIISEWLSVKDRFKLDSAHCQASVREEFLQLNRSPELSVKSWEHGKKNIGNRALVTWAMIREVYVEKLSVRTLLFPNRLDLYNSYLRRFGSRVFMLLLNCTNITSLAQSTATCCNLIVLKLLIWKLCASLRDVFVCCPRLREFSFRSSSGFFLSCDPEPLDPPLTCAHIDTLVCNNLKYLELEEGDVDLVAAFLRMAVAVDVVFLTTKDVLINSIQESMSSTASTLSLFGNIIDAGLANFSPRGEQLENLCFPSCDVTDTAISALSKFPNLRALDLTDARLKSENVFKVLANACGDKLTELLLYYCNPTLPLVTVQEVLPLFTRLESFSLRFEDNHTGVWNMSSFSRITKLLLGYEGAKEAELVSTLTEHCHANIRELSLRMVASDLAVNQLNILVSACTKLRILNLDIVNDNQYCYADEDIARWKKLRPGLAVGGYCEHLLNVFDKYECSVAW